MRKQYCTLVFIIVCLAFFSANYVQAGEHGTDVSSYLGQTVEYLYNTFPGSLWEGQDTLCSGRSFLTDGKACFYYEYCYEGDSMMDSVVNRVVLNNNCGSEYWIGSLPGGATFGDEYAGLKSMGYELILQTGDWRDIWQDSNSHLIIVTRGQWAGACEIDYSMIVDEDY